MSIFEQYPRPWKLVELNPTDYIIQDANGYRVSPTPQIFTFAHGGTAFWDEVIECVNALDGIDFPEAWVNSMSDAIKGYKATIRAKDQRIQELEQQVKNAWQVIGDNSIEVQKQIVEDVALRARIAELEQEAKDTNERIADFERDRLKHISAAIYFFTGNSVSESDILDWSNGIDPTQPIDE